MTSPKQSSPVKKFTRKSQARGAVNARSQAQQIAFAPVVFYASVVMRDTGLLNDLAAAGSEGLTLNGISAKTGLSEYAVSVLMDLAVDVDIVQREGAHFILADVGYFLMNDTMTRVNMDFVRDICYKALPYLEQSLTEGVPAGLHTLGDWTNVYEGLSKLDEPARSSWFRFDNYYSDTVFDSLIPVVFDTPVKHLLDIGANTGKWGAKCLAHDPEVQVTMVDLPGQLAMAEKTITEAGYKERATFVPMNVLEEDRGFPAGCDVIWMSQFLDCFSPDEIQSILRRLLTVMTPQTRMYILEPFSDRQQYKAASLSLNATSLYFSCVANGNSRMYPLEQFRSIVLEAGLAVEQEVHLNFGHSLLVCRRPE